MTADTRAALRLPDGTATFVRDWPVPAGVTRRGSILLVHGLGEHSGRYGHVAERLAALGLEVCGYDLRGHGRSEGARGSIPRDDALLDDLRLVFGELDRRGRAAGDDAPPLLLGHSLGGTIAAAGTAGGWVAPRALVLSSPALALHVTRPRAAVLKLARRLIPDRALPNALPVDKLSHDPAEVEAYRTDALVHDRITPRMYGFLADAGAAVRRDAARLTVPTLLLVAGDDALVDAHGSRELAAALAPGIGTLHFYDGLYHEIFNEREPDRARVLDDLARLARAAAQPLGATTVRSGQAGSAGHGSSCAAGASTQYSLAGPSIIWRCQALASPPSAAASSPWNASYAIPAGLPSQAAQPGRAGSSGPAMCAINPATPARAAAAAASCGALLAPETAAALSVPSAAKSSTRYQSS